MVMISLSASPAWGPRFLAGWASWLSSRASQCGPKAWQKSSNWQTSSTSRSNMDASPHLMAPTQKEELKGDKGLASLQTRNSGYLLLSRCNVRHHTGAAGHGAQGIPRDYRGISVDASGQRKSTTPKRRRGSRLDGPGHQRD